MLRTQTPRSAPKRPTILRLVVLFLLLSLAPLAALAVSSVRVASDALQTEVEQRVASSAELSAEAVRGELAGVEDLVQSYARRPSLVRTLSAARPSEDELRFQLRELRQARPGIAVAFLARPDGRLVAISPATPAIIGKDFSFRDWYRGATRSGRVYVSEAYISQAAGNPIVVAVATVVGDDAGRRLGILVAAYDLNALRVFIDRFSQSQALSLRLTDQRGTLLAEPGFRATRLVSRRADPLVAAALRGESDVVSQERGDASRLVAYRPIRDLGWTVAASVPERSALAPLGSLRSSVYGAASLLALVLLGGLALLVRSLQQRRRAEQEADEARAEADRRQADSARLAAIVDSSDDAILSMTPEGVITSWNGGAELLYGYTAAEAVGRPIEILIPTEQRGEQHNILRHVLAGNPLRGYETRRQRKDGTLVDVALTVSPIRDEEDRVTGASTIARDISERRRTEDEARRAWAEADRANRAKSEFLSRMSHELRTPMNAVLGFAQLLELDDLSDEQRESVEQILRAGNHLLALINEVLDVARIEAGKLSLSLEPVDADETLHEAVDLIRPLAADRGVTLSVDTGGEDVCVRADRQRLKQVLLNLLSNAVKYNRTSGRVDVTVRRQPNESIRVCVTDTGAGISREQLERLFQPFERLDADAGSVEGTGLGLTLSKGLVEAMDGRIGVDSRLGEGSTFWFELEALEPRLPLEPGTTDHERETATVGHAGSVLYIEDNLSNLKLVEQVFARFPHIELLAAMQGTLGLDLAREHRPDLILLDLHLPDVDGEEVLARLRAEPETAAIPVVVVSADVTPGRLERLLASGADDYLPKPIDVSRFMQTLRHHLPEYEAAAEGGRVR